MIETCEFISRSYITLYECSPGYECYNDVMLGPGVIYMCYIPIKEEN